MTPDRDRPYPETSTGSFPPPPHDFEDARNRTLQVRTDGDAFESLVAMYEQFRPEDRAQGVPPFQEDSIRSWLESLMQGINVVAWHDERVVGHATLVPDEGDAYELAIFVLGEYQGAGIGTQLIERLLGEAQRQGVEKVWLTVERWNQAAIALYEKVGFKRTQSDRLELEMSLRL